MPKLFDHTDRSPTGRAAVALLERVAKPTMREAAVRLGNQYAEGASAIPRAPDPLPGFEALHAERALRSHADAAPALRRIPEAAKVVRQTQPLRDAAAVRSGEADNAAEAARDAASRERAAEPHRAVSQASLTVAAVIVGLAVVALAAFEVVVFRPSMELVLAPHFSNQQTLNVVAPVAALIPALLSATFLWVAVEMRPRFAKPWWSGLALCGLLLPLLAVLVIASQARDRNAKASAEALASSDISALTVPQSAGGLFGATGAGTTAPDASPAGGDVFGDTSAGQPSAPAADSITERADYTPLLLVNLLGVGVVTGVHLLRQRRQEADREHAMWRERVAHLDAGARAAQAHATGARTELRGHDERLERAQTDYQQAALEVRGVVERHALLVAQDRDITRTAYLHRCTRTGQPPVALRMPEPVDVEAMLESLLDGALPGQRQPANPPAPGGGTGGTAGGPGVNAPADDDPGAPGPGVDEPGADDETTITTASGRGPDAETDDWGAALGDALDELL